MYQPTLNDIVSLAKRRGFIFPGSEIYGGLANTYDYGPLGVELMRNIKNAWWNFFVASRHDMFGLDTSILMSPRVWEASGHTENFADVLLDCKSCQLRTRADHLIEDYFEAIQKSQKVEGLDLSELQKILDSEKIPCPQCKEFNWTDLRKFNQLFETEIGIITGKKNTAYLRGEIAQGMFVNFKQVLDSMRPKLPFGLAQSGAAFRNEITLGNFTFRTLQFNLAEFEYFFDPEKQPWEQLFEYWQNLIWTWATEILGLYPENLRWRPHTPEELSHYSTRTEDIDFKFPFGFKEMHACAYRTDFDLRNHMEKSGQDLRYTDPENPERKFIPHVMEPTFGMDRAVLAVLCNGYEEQEINGKKRTVLKIKPKLAPYKAAVFPLLANKQDLRDKADEIFLMLLKKFSVTTDARGNIGKRYFSQDEIGTPYCITIDFDTLNDQSVTVRDRDTMEQERVPIHKLVDLIDTKISAS